MSEHDETYEVPVLTDLGTIQDRTQQIDLSIIIGGP